MNEKIQLTKESDYLICILYKTYLQSRKSGNSKYKARFFGSSHDIHNKLLSKWMVEDVDETCRELARAGVVECLYADDIAYEVVLNDAGIIYMEERFKNNIKSVLDYLAKIKSLIPFV